MAGYADNQAYDLAGLNAQRHRIDDAYTTGMAKNTYSQGIAGINHLDQLAKLRLGQTRSEGGWRSSFAQRGLRNSGIYADSLSHRQTDAMTAEADVNRNYLMDLGGMQNEARGLNTARWSGIGDVDALKQTVRDRVSASLSGS